LQKNRDWLTQNPQGNNLMTLTGFMTYEATLNHKIDENVKKTYMIIQSDRSFFLFFTAFTFLPAGPVISGLGREVSLFSLPSHTPPPPSLTNSLANSQVHLILNSIVNHFFQPNSFLRRFPAELKQLFCNNCSYFRQPVAY
jgi:hypothetical protein